MRLLAIGDMHGCTRALDTLLDLVGLQSDDRLITLGDYVDRGPDTRGLLDRLVSLADAGWIAAALRGNHDSMLQRVQNDRHELGSWVRFGGDTTLASYGGLEDVPEEHWDFLRNRCRDWYETETHIFVHATLIPHLPLAEQPHSALHWEKLTDQGPHESGKVLICGHTHQKNGLPLNLGHTICIDTYVYGPEGWLTCLEVQGGRIWQANEQGERRTGNLGDLGSLRTIEKRQGER